VPISKFHDSKECSKCGVCKPISEFQKDRRVADGRQARCRACKKEYEQDRQKNPSVREQSRLNGKASYARHAEKQRAESRKYYDENRDRLLPRAKERNKKRYETDEAFRRRVNARNAQWSRDNRERA
jgi:hypothetical protein